MILIKMKESCFKVQQPPSKQQQTFKTFSLEMVMASFYFLKTGFYTITLNIHKYRREKKYLKK